MQDLQKALIVNLQSTIPENTQKNYFACCAYGREKTQMTESVWEKNSRTHETMEIWNKIANGPYNIHKMTPQQRQARFENQWHLVPLLKGASAAWRHREEPLRARFDNLGIISSLRRNNVGAQAEWCDEFEMRGLRHHKAEVKCSEWPRVQDDVQDS